MCIRGTKPHNLKTKEVCICPRTREICLVMWEIRHFVAKWIGGSMESPVLKQTVLIFRVFFFFCVNYSANLSFLSWYCMTITAWKLTRGEKGVQFPKLSCLQTNYVSQLVCSDCICLESMRVFLLHWWLFIGFIFCDGIFF